MSAAISIHDGKPWPNTGSPAAAALAYHGRGLHTVKLLPGGKNQAPGQIAKRMTDAQVRQAWVNTDGFNIGVVWGPLSNWAVDVHLSHEAREAAAIILPPTATFGRDGSADHWVVYSQDAQNTEWVPQGDTTPVIEIRAEGKHTVMPPSIHADSGQRVAWTNPASKTDAARILADELSEACAHVALAVVLRRQWETLHGDDVASALLNCGVSAFSARAILKAASGNDHADAVKAFEQARGEATAKTVADASGNPPQVAAAFGWVASGYKPEPAWGAALKRDKYNKPKGTIHNVMHVLSRHPQCVGMLGLETFTGSVLFLKPPPWNEAKDAPSEVSDADTAEAIAWMTRECDIDAGPDVVFASINAVATRYQYDVLVEYLSALKWDGVSRIGSWLTEYLGVAENHYTSEVGMRWLIAGAARGMRPGCKVDTMLVLEGPQGIYKSTALKILASPQWFTDHLPPINEIKNVAEALPGNWIVENAELDGIGKADVTRIKQFLATTEDKVRLSYGRRRTTLKRRCIFAGTTNDAAYLKDDTGNRRFWPILCGTIDREALARDRDQLWAEAMAALAAGAEWHLDKETEALAAIEQEKRYEADPWEEFLADEFRNAKSVTSIDAFEALESGPDKDGHPVAKSTPKQRSKVDQMRVGKILRRIGFTRRIRRADGWHFERAE